MQLPKHLIFCLMLCCSCESAVAEEEGATVAVQSPATSKPKPRANITVSATMDASGHIKLASNSPAAAPQWTGGLYESSTAAILPLSASTPCPNAKPLSAEEAKHLVVETAESEQFYPGFVLTVAKIESHFNSSTISPRGAYGLMQLKPETAKSLGVDICNPADNVRGGIRLLRALHAKYRNPMYILAAYNAGEAALLKYGGIPPFPETVEYISKVLNDFYDFPILNAEAKNSKFIDLNNRQTANNKRFEGTAASPGANWQSGFVQNFD